MEEAVIFRAVPEISRQLHQAIEGQRSDVSLSLSCTDEATGEYRVTFACTGMRTHFKAFLVNLPCIVEVQKTSDHEQYYKSGNLTKAMVLVPDSCTAGEVEGLIETPGGIQALDSGLTPPTNKIVQRRFIPAARSIVQSRASSDLKVDESFSAQTLSNLESMLVQMKDNKGKDTKGATVKELAFEDVVPTADFMREWPDDVTIEYHDGRPVLVTALAPGAGIINIRDEAAPASTAAQSAASGAAAAPLAFEPLAMLSGL